MAERGQRARLVHEPLQPPLKRLRRLARLGVDRAVFGARGKVAGQVFLQCHLEVEVAVGGEIGQAEAARSQHRFDAVLVQRVAAGQRVGDFRHGHLSWRAYFSISSIAFSRLRRMRLNDLRSSATSSPPVSLNSGISMLPVLISSAAFDMRVMGRTISALIMTLRMMNSTTNTALSDAMKV